MTYQPLDPVTAVANEIKLVPPAYRDIEPDLYASRWFDYRRALPSQATDHFRRAYDTVYREYYAKTVDTRKAHSINTMTGKSLFTSPDLLAFWKGRQEADRMGCKYDFYLRFVFARNLERGWRYLPRPNQLFNEEISIDVEKAWCDIKRATLQLAVNSDFLPANYRGLPEQDSYHEYLVQQIQSREVQYLVLARLVYKERVIPISVASKTFDAALLSRAHSWSML